MNSRFKFSLIVISACAVVGLGIVGFTVGQDYKNVKDEQVTEPIEIEYGETTGIENEGHSDEPIEPIVDTEDTTSEEPIETSTEEIVMSEEPVSTEATETTEFIKSPEATKSIEPVETEKIVETTKVEETTALVENTYSEPKTLYTTTYLNMRDYPSVEGKVIKSLSPNTEVTAIAEVNGWIKIVWTTNGNTNHYYLRDKYLSTEKQKQETTVNVTTNNTEPQTSNNSNGNEYLGKFKLTAYCNCSKCCGKWAGGVTASGTYPTAGRTIAMGGIPFGTKLLINGTVYTVEDRGTPYGHIDIFFNSHSEAIQFGVRYADVYKVN